MASFLGFDLTGLLAPVAIEANPPRKKGQVMQVTLGTILNWIITMQLFAYNSNRGNGDVSAATIRRIKENGVNPDIIGECTIGFWNVVSDNEGEDPKLKLCFNNWHSRACGFLALLKDGKLSKKDLDTPVSIRVQHDFLKGYQGMNASGSAHRTQDKIRNPNLAYGVVIKNIFDALSDGCKEAIGEKRWTVFSSILYNMTLNDPAVEWPDIYGKRLAAGKIADQVAGYLSVSPAKQQAMIEAIRFWHDVITKLESNPAGVRVTKIKRSAGFFGYIIVDRLRSTSRISDNYKVIVKRILKNIEKMLKIAPELCRGQKIDVEKWTAHLDKILRRRGCSKAEAEAA